MAAGVDQSRECIAQFPQALALLILPLWETITASCFFKSIPSMQTKSFLEGDVLAVLASLELEHLETSFNNRDQCYYYRSCFQKLTSLA